MLILPSCAEDVKSQVILGKVTIYQGGQHQPLRLGAQGSRWLIFGFVEPCGTWQLSGVKDGGGSWAVLMRLDVPQSSLAGRPSVHVLGLTPDVPRAPSNKLSPSLLPTSALICFLPNIYHHLA